MVTISIIHSLEEAVKRDLSTKICHIQTPFNEKRHTERDGVEAKSKPIKTGSAYFTNRKTNAILRQIKKRLEMMQKGAKTMPSVFSQTLSGLRREKKISQRTAAQAMGISQALLSHYENGIREPGLTFVVRACDYYEVSADVLLGRNPHVAKNTDAVSPEAPFGQTVMQAVSLLFTTLSSAEQTALIQTIQTRNL